MGESRLFLKMADLQGEIGDYLGWGVGEEGGEEAWSDDKLADINRVLRTALRWVYFEASVIPDQPPHQWSFLTPSISITCASGQRTMALPQDFSSFAGTGLAVTLGTSGGVYSKVTLVGDAFIDEKYAKVNSHTGRPIYAAERIRKGVGQDHSTIRELFIYPEPDAAYTFRGPYNLVPDALTEKSPYVYGGTEMAGCFQAACRAAAEVYRDNIAPGQGAEWAVFQRSLAMAVMRDGRHAPKTVGINRDLSDPSRWIDGGDAWWSDGTIRYVDPVTLEGEVP